LTKILRNDTIISLNLENLTYPEGHLLAKTNNTLKNIEKYIRRNG